MAWFADLTPYTYIPVESGDAPTLNVGWLERGQAFPTGNVSAEFVARLELLAAHAYTQQTRGLHGCDLCDDGIDWEDDAVRRARTGSYELRAVSKDGTRYAAPSLIVHYVKQHGYAPPQVFVEL